MSDSAHARTSLLVYKQALYAIGHVTVLAQGFSVSLKDKRLSRPSACVIHIFRNMTFVSDGCHLIFEEQITPSSLTNACEQNQNRTERTPKKLWYFVGLLVGLNNVIGFI